MGVDQATYQRWQALHLRVARGEGLTGADQAFYQTVCRQLEREEVLREPSPDLRAARTALKSLEAEHAALEARRQLLDADIAALEAALAKQTGQPLSVEG